MAKQRKKAEKGGENVVDYRHKSVKRLNIPPAGLTARGDTVREKKVRYAWGRLGVWDFVVCRDPALLPRQVAQGMASPQVKEA